MNRVSRILAGVDFSQTARDAFDYALALGTLYGAEIVVVHAVRPDRPFSWQARARTALLAQFRQKAAQARVTFSERVQSGDAAEIILLHAGSLRPEVIVMGTHQRSAIERLRLGSVARRVIARATVPVLLVPADRGASTTPPFRHIAVAVDFSPSSDAAIERAIALAAGANGRLTLIHVVPGFSSTVRPYLDGYAVVPYQDERIREARQRLRIAASAAAPARMPIDTRVVAGDIATEIHRLVDSSGADALVVGAPRRGALARAMFGTTAARLLKSARVPLIAMPDAKRLATGDGPARRLAA